ncbi:MAG: CAP domain-containing protein [Thermodesulfobacteriota bacterium]
MPIRRAAFKIAFVCAVFFLAAGFEWAQESVITQFDRQVIAEMNQARTDPREYARIILAERDLYEGRRKKTGENCYLITKEGVTALDEAVAFLRRQQELSCLGISEGMSRASKDHVADQGPYGGFGHEGTDGSQPWDRLSRHGRWRKTVAENISYGAKTARDVVIQLIIDDGVPDRGHRTNIFNPAFQLAGVAHGPHIRFRTMCDITYAGGFEEQ